MFWKIKKSRSNFFINNHKSSNKNLLVTFSKLVYLIKISNLNDPGLFSACFIFYFHKMRLLLCLFAYFHASPLSKSNLALEDEDFEVSSNYIYDLYDKLLEDFLYFDYLTEMITPWKNKFVKRNVLSNSDQLPFLLVFFFSAFQAIIPNSLLSANKTNYVSKVKKWTGSRRDKQIGTFVVTTSASPRHSCTSSRVS